MNNQSKSDYLLLFRGTEWQQRLSPEELQRLMSDFTNWFSRLTAEGSLKVGQPLMHEGRVVSGQRGRIVADGPFAESKEAIGGYFLLNVDSLDEAVAIAQDCPTLMHGGSVEVRPVAAECPLAQKLRENQNAEVIPAGV